MRVNKTKTHHNIYSFNKAKIFKLFRVSFFSFCLVATLISITQSFNKASAVESSSSATASVTVSSACSFSRVNEGDGNYTGTLSNGSDTEIIGSTFKTICNDPGGYAIYAIGYSNNTLGNTDLIFNDTPESTNNIKTDGDTQTGGNGSYWKMKLSPVSGDFAPTIENSYSNYNDIPSNYTKVASFNNVTVNSSDSTTGSSITASYQAYASSTQPAGTYTGAVKYTMVHPSTNVPNEPRNCTANKICYYPNAGNTVADTMGDQTIGASDASVTLWASNFQRPGYGFAGWSDTCDYVVNEGSESNPDAHIYGPNETISFTAGQYSGTNGGLSLYAVWVEPAKDISGNELTFQTTNLLTTTLSDNTTLNSKSTNYVTALRDKRDGQVYAVAKLADGNYWMIENLRLEAEYTRGDYYQSLAQGYGGVFVGLADVETENFDSSTVANSLYSANNITGTSTAYRFPRYNNDNTNNSVTSMTATNANIYSYGNYYTWSAAIANTGFYDSNTDTINTSICPVGWHLPYGFNDSGTNGGNTSGGFYYLNYKLNNDSNVVDDVASSNLRKYPSNFIYSGRFTDGSAYSRGTSGLYRSSSPTDNIANAYDLRFSSYDVDPGTYEGHKGYGRAIRCVNNS